MIATAINTITPPPQILLYLNAQVHRIHYFPHPQQLEPHSHHHLRLPLMQQAHLYQAPQLQAATKETQVMLKDQ